MEDLKSFLKKKEKVCEGQKSRFVKAKYLFSVPLDKDILLKILQSDFLDFSYFSFFFNILSLAVEVFL